PELSAVAGVTQALHHAQNLDDPSDLILTGGDSIMDSFSTDRARADLQWKLWQEVFENECSLPVKSCLGNHDIWGWNKEASLTSGSEAGWGKQLAVEQLGLPHRYYSFDHSGWHFIALDSVRHNPDNPNGYLAFLDEDQYSWLVEDLGRTQGSTPVLIFSHIPILTITVLTHGNAQDNKHVISGGSLHLDGAKLKDLFNQHPNVKLCLSGHIHLVDEAVYNGVTYCCNGAVCGNWWKGNHKECDEGYALLDLYDDGSFETQYVVYDWTPKA
ncbi:MAG: metallophosphoesterase family protein, partial [bacterium]